MAEHLPPGNHRIAIEVNGRQREYLVRVPASREGEAPAEPEVASARAAQARQEPRPLKTHPVVVLLHGTGGTVVWTQQEARFDRVAEREGVIVVYPQALPPDPAQPPRFLANPPAWEDGREFPDRPVFDDLAFFRAMLDDLTRRVPIDPARIYATGFSNGASMCFRLAAELSDRIAAIAPIAGYFRQDAIVRPVPTLFIIGEVDPMVPPKGGEIFIPWTGKTTQRPAIRGMLDRWATLLGNSPPAVVESDVGGVRVERYPGPVEMLYVTVEGLGHHWPGGRGQLKEELAGPWNERFDGNEAIWRFFSRHQLG